MNGKFRHIKTNNNDSNVKKKFIRHQDELGENNLGKNRLKEKMGKKTHDKKSKLNKSMELDEKRVIKRKKDISDTIDDASNSVRCKSSTKRKVRKIEPDNPKKITSSSYEKRNLNNKKPTEKGKELKLKNKGIKKLKKVEEDEDDMDINKLKRKVKKTQTEIPQQSIKPKKFTEVAKKTIAAKKVTQNEKTAKNNNSHAFEKKNIKKIDEQNGGTKIKKEKKFLTNKDRTITSGTMKKKGKKIEGDEDEENPKKETKRKQIIGKSVDKISGEKGVDKKIKNSLEKKKTIKKKEESDSGSSSDSESSSSSGSSSKSKSSKSSKSSKKSKSSSKSSKSNSKKSSAKSESSSNRTYSSPTPSSSGSDSESDNESPKKKENEKGTKKEEANKMYNKSKTTVIHENIKLESIDNDKKDKKEEKKEEKKDDKKDEKKDEKKDDKKDEKKEEKQKKEEPPAKKAPAEGRKGSIILGSQYLRRRSMDNPFTRERLELLVNQMTLKQNGGNTLFLKNYENGPSYEKDITIITKDKQSVKKHIKINECTKAGCSGPGIVKTNQDAYFVKENFLKNSDYFFIGVCDGHGEQGHIVSNYVINKLPNYIPDLSNESITEAFKKINKEIYANSKMDSNMSGTTVVSIILTPNNLICVNLGDSRASLFRYENGLYYCRNLSRDHKPCEPDESKRILFNGGRVKKCYDEEHKRFIGPDRVWMKNKEEPGLAMTRSLGDKIAHNIGVTDEPEFKTFPFDGTEKFIILASDGLWEYVNGDQCINIVKPFYEEGKDSKEAALALVKEAFRKWKRKEVAIDDITVVVIFFD